MTNKEYTSADVQIEDGVCVIPEGVTSIGDYAFSWCESLTSVQIPEGVTSIGNGAFYDCKSLTSVQIPEGVTSIGDDAFRCCESLTSITYRGEHTVRCIDGYCMEILKNRTVGEYTIYKAKYFESGRDCVIAEKNGTFAHGKTVQESVRDLKFKLCKERGIEQYEGYTLDSMVDYMFYRVMTGACQTGTEEFLRIHGMSLEDKRSIRQVIEMTKGQFGHEQLIHNLKELGILEG